MDDSQTPVPNIQTPSTPPVPAPEVPPGLPSVPQSAPEPAPLNTPPPLPMVESTPTIIPPASEHPHKSSALPLILALVILLLAVAGGGYYYFVYRTAVVTQDTGPNDQVQLNDDVTSPNTGFDTTNGNETSADAVPTVSTSDNVNDIDKEIQATDVQGAETDFQDVNTDLNNL